MTRCARMVDAGRRKFLTGAGFAAASDAIEGRHAKSRMPTDARPAPKDFLRRLFQRCNNVGALLGIGIAEDGFRSTRQKFARRRQEFIEIGFGPCATGLPQRVGIAVPRVARLARPDRQTALAYRARLSGTQAGGRARAFRRARMARLPSPRHAVHRGLRIPDLRAGDDSPLRTSFHHSVPETCRTRRLPTQRIRRYGPSVTSQTQSQPCVDG
jgi:hypothetical protein